MNFSVWWYLCCVSLLLLLHDSSSLANKDILARVLPKGPSAVTLDRVRHTVKHSPIVFRDNSDTSLQLPVKSNFIENEFQFGLAKSYVHRFYVWKAPPPSVGMPWPAVERLQRNERQLISFPTSSSSIIIYVNSRPVDNFNAVIQETVSRFLLRVDKCVGITHVPSPTATNILEEVGNVTLLQNIQVTIATISQQEPWPSLDMKESYSLHVHNNGIIHIHTDAEWGFVRAMETLSQLMFIFPTKKMYAFESHIDDGPKFPHRGLMIDTSRHYISVPILLTNIDAMVMNKMNVFHWHMVDDQSFPFKGNNFPEMADKGAFTPEKVYTLKDVALVVEYARRRGVRVIPEFDAPSHTLSWGHTKNILTECYEGTKSTGFYGPLDPSLKRTYDVLSGLYEDILSVFQDDYLHLGGDEVDTSCWSNNPLVAEFLKSVQKTGVLDLQHLFFSELQKLLTKTAQSISKKPKKFIIWQETMEKEIPFPPADTIVQVWMMSVQDALKKAALGKQIIFSSCYYLDRPKYGTQWVEYYRCDLGIDPAESKTDPGKSWMKNVLGGEACMWNEYQTEDTMTGRIWPLASAVAERLWTRNSALQFGSGSLSETASRLEEHRCRMLSEGITTGVASGPAECSQYFEKLKSRDLQSNTYHKIEEMTSLGLINFKNHIFILLICIIFISFSYFLFLQPQRKCFVSSRRLFASFQIVVALGVLIFVAYLILSFSHF